MCPKPATCTLPITPVSPAPTNYSLFFNIDTSGIMCKMHEWISGTPTWLFDILHTILVSLSILSESMSISS